MPIEYSVFGVLGVIGALINILDQYISHEQAFNRYVSVILFIVTFTSVVSWDEAMKNGFTCGFSVLQCAYQY